MTPDLIPLAFRPSTTDVSERMSVPPDIVAIGQMIAAAALIAGKVAIRPRRNDDWTIKPTLWGACIAQPGVLKKSPSLKAALAPLEKLEQREREERVLEGFDAEVQKSKLKALREEISRMAKNQASDSEMEALRGNYEELEQLPRRVIVNDATVEKLAEIFAKNSSLLLLRDELYGWTSAMEREGHEGDRQFHLECWEPAGALRVDRIIRGSSTIGQRLLSVLGSFQPDLLVRYLHETLRHGNDGFISRFQLLVWPDVTDWRNVDRKPNREAQEQVDEVFGRLWRLNAAQLGAQLDDRDNETRFVRFTPEAQPVFERWYDALENELRGDAHPLFVQHLSKFRSLVPKIALIEHVLQNAEREQPELAVSLANLKFAIRWSEYLKSHAARVYYAVTEKAGASAHSLASRILNRKLPDIFRLREVYQRHWTALATKEDAELAAEILEDAGWVRREERDRRQVFYHVNLRIHELAGNPKGAGKGAVA